MILTKLIISCFFLYFFIFLVSRKFKFYDFPSNRKIHKFKTINTGGLIIYFYYLMIINFFEFNQNVEFIIAVGIFICLTGFIDDRIVLQPSIKIIFIGIPSIYLIFNGISINSLGNYEYLGNLYLGKFQFPFLILALGLLINATNYIDGVDGLLLTFFLSFLCYTIILIDDPKTDKLLAILLVPVVINLILNLLPSGSNFKLFNGDSGSLFIGFFVSFLTIELSNNFNIHPVYLIWPLWYPVFDFLFICFKRVSLNKSIFVADKSHLHHRLYFHFKKNSLKVIFLFFIINSLIIFIGYLIGSYSKILSLSTFIFSCIIYILIRFNFEKNGKNKKYN